MMAGHAALLALKSGTAGQDRLRPGRGHGGDHQAPSLHRAAPHRAHAGRPAGRHGRRSHSGRRRVRHAEPGGAFARLHPCRRVRIAATTSRICGSRHVHQHAAQWRVPRLRRARRPSSRSRSTWSASPRRWAWIRCALRRDAMRCGPATPPPRASASVSDCSARQVLRRSGAAHRTSAASATAYRGHQPRHRPRALLSRRRLHRQRRAQARLHAPGSSSPRPASGSLTSQHRDRPGHPHHARADRRRRAGHSIRAASRSRSPTPAWCRQRADRRLAHLHDRGGHSGGVRAR